MHFSHPSQAQQKPVIEVITLELIAANTHHTVTRRPWETTPDPRHTDAIASLLKAAREMRDFKVGSGMLRPEAEIELNPKVLTPLVRELLHQQAVLPETNDELPESHYSLFMHFSVSSGAMLRSQNFVMIGWVNDGEVFINSVMEVHSTPIRGEEGHKYLVEVVSANHVLANAAYRGIGDSDHQLHIVSPETVIQTAALSELGLGGNVDVFDSRNTVTAVPRYSNYANDIPEFFMAKTLKAIDSGKHISKSLNRDTPWDLASQIAAEPTPHRNPVLRAFSDAGPTSLLTASTTVDFLKKLDVKDVGVQTVCAHNNLLRDYDSMDGSSIVDNVGYAALTRLTAFMALAGIRTLKLHISNHEEAEDQPVKIEQINMIVPDMNPFGPVQDKLREDIEKFILRPLSLDGMVHLSLDIEADLAATTFIRVTFGNEKQKSFAVPTYMDSLYGPASTKDAKQLTALAEGIAHVFNQSL